MRKNWKKRRPDGGLSICVSSKPQRSESLGCSQSPKLCETHFFLVFNKGFVGTCIFTHCRNHQRSNVSLVMEIQRNEGITFSIWMASGHQVHLQMECSTWCKSWIAGNSHSLTYLLDWTPSEQKGHRIASLGLSSYCRWWIAKLQWASKNWWSISLHT